MQPSVEKCIIYDGGARRYEIHEHVEEVLEFWNGIKGGAPVRLILELYWKKKLGYELPNQFTKTGSMQTPL